MSLFGSPPCRSSVVLVGDASVCVCVLAGGGQRRARAERGDVRTGHGTQLHGTTHTLSILRGLD